MQVKIQFIKFGANSAFGGFAPGDTMRCGAEMARHLVEEVGCAKYTEAPAASAAAADVDAQPESAPKRTRKAK